MGQLILTMVLLAFTVINLSETYESEIETIETSDTHDTFQKHLLELLRKKLGFDLDKYKNVNEEYETKGACTPADTRPHVLNIPDYSNLSSNNNIIGRKIENEHIDILPSTNVRDFNNTNDIRRWIFGKPDESVNRKKYSLNSSVDSNIVTLPDFDNTEDIIQWMFSKPGRNIDVEANHSLINPEYTLPQEIIQLILDIPEYSKPILNNSFINTDTLSNNAHTLQPFIIKWIIENLQNGRSIPENLLQWFFSQLNTVLPPSSTGSSKPDKNEQIIRLTLPRQTAIPSNSKNNKVSNNSVEDIIFEWVSNKNLQNKPKSINTSKTPKMRNAPYVSNTPDISNMIPNFSTGEIDPQKHLEWVLNAASKLIQANQQSVNNMNNQNYNQPRYRTNLPYNNNLMSPINNIGQHGNDNLNNLLEWVLSNVNTGIGNNNHLFQNTGDFLSNKPRLRSKELEHSDEILFPQIPISKSDLENAMANWDTAKPHSGDLTRINLHSWKPSTVDETLIEREPILNGNLPITLLNDYPSWNPQLFNSPDNNRDQDSIEDLIELISGQSSGTQNSKFPVLPSGDSWVPEYTTIKLPHLLASNEILNTKKPENNFFENLFSRQPVKNSLPSLPIKHNSKNVQNGDYPSFLYYLNNNNLLSDKTKINLPKALKTKGGNLYSDIPINEKAIHNLFNEWWINSRTYNGSLPPPYVLLWLPTPGNKQESERTIIKPIF